jgi:hypothetical protein
MNNVNFSTPASKYALPAPAEAKEPLKLAQEKTKKTWDGVKLGFVALVVMSVTAAVLVFPPIGIIAVGATLGYAAFGALMTMAAVHAVAPWLLSKTEAAKTTLVVQEALRALTSDLETAKHKLSVATQNHGNAEAYELEVGEKFGRDMTPVEKTTLRNNVGKLHEKQERCRESVAYLEKEISDLRKACLELKPADLQKYAEDVIVASSRENQAAQVKKHFEKKSLSRDKALKGFANSTQHRALRSERVVKFSPDVDVVIVPTTLAESILRGSNKQAPEVEDHEVEGDDRTINYFGEGTRFFTSLAKNTAAGFNVPEEGSAGIKLPEGFSRFGVEIDGKQKSKTRENRSDGLRQAVSSKPGRQDSPTPIDASAPRR